MRKNQKTTLKRALFNVNLLIMQSTLCCANATSQTQDIVLLGIDEESVFCYNRNISKRQICKGFEKGFQIY